MKAFSPNLDDRPDKLVSDKSRNLNPVATQSPPTLDSDWLTHILNVTGALPLVDRDLFCSPQTSSSVVFS